MKVGLTGNMGSGKTTVSSVFSTLNIPVFHADDEAKRMYQRDDVREQVQPLQVLISLIHPARSI